MQSTQRPPVVAPPRYPTATTRPVNAKGSGAPSGCGPTTAAGGGTSRSPRKALAALRRRAGHTQADLALELQVARSTVTRWERGLTAPALPQRRRLAEALGLDSAELDGVLDAPEDRAEPAATLDLARLLRTEVAALLAPEPTPTIATRTCGIPSPLNEALTAAATLVANALLRLDRFEEAAQWAAMAAPVPPDT
jgi:transcriptional regulator with XRE-family HTH domain